MRYSVTKNQETNLRTLSVQIKDPNLIQERKVFEKKTWD